MSHMDALVFCVRLEYSSSKVCTYQFRGLQQRTQPERHGHTPGQAAQADARRGQHGLGLVVLEAEERLRGLRLSRMTRVERELLHSSTRVEEEPPLDARRGAIHCTQLDGPRAGCPPRAPRSGPR